MEFNSGFKGLIIAGKFCAEVTGYNREVHLNYWKIFCFQT